jgi:hypothetical protein
LPQVFAGFVAGYAVALIATPLLALSLLKMRTSGGALSRLLPEGTSVVGLSVLLHGAMFIAWTGLGLILGLLLYAMRDAEGAAGSLNAPFTLLVAALTLMIFAPLAILAPSLRKGVIGLALAATLVFGWGMPYLASWQ